MAAPMHRLAAQMALFSKSVPLAVQSGLKQSGVA